MEGGGEGGGVTVPYSTPHSGGAKLAAMWPGLPQRRDLLPSGWGSLFLEASSLQPLHTGVMLNYSLH